MPSSESKATWWKPTTQLEAPFAPSPPIPWRPEAFQVKGAKFLLERSGAGLFLDPGMRKTSITLAAIKTLKKRRELGRALVLAPLRPAWLVWPKEIMKWQEFAGLKFAVLHGPTKDEHLWDDVDICIVNYEGLEWLLQLDKTKTPSGKTRVGLDQRRWRRLGFDVLVPDELSRFKHTNTNRFKAIRQVLPTFKRRWGLTGSPAANGLMGLFGQAFTLDVGKTFGPYVTHYRTKYFVPSANGFDWDLRAGADKEIYAAMKPLALRMSAEDYLDLPQVVENDIMVDLPPAARKVYDALEADMIAKIGNGVVTAANAGVSSMKCRQVASGGVYLDQDMELLIKAGVGEREWVNLHEAKTDALADLVDELQGEPLLVAYDFKHDLDRLLKRFGKDTPWIGGGTTTKRAAELEAAWNRGELPLLFGHPQSIGHGMNMQEVGHHVCWHTMIFDFELYDQFIRRLLRSGQKAKKLFVHRIIASGTVDLDARSALRAKDKGQRAFFDALKERLASRIKK